jgi:hypothetical protein
VAQKSSAREFGNVSHEEILLRKSFHIGKKVVILKINRVLMRDNSDIRILNIMRKWHVHAEYH